MAKQPTKAETAFESIRQRIESGELGPGARITLQALADDLGVSLTPVREALRMLQASGLVEYRPHQGHVVTRYSIARGEEAYLLRELLEPLATRLACERASERELEAINEIHERFAQLIENPDLAVGMVELNARWHRAIYDAAHSPLLDEFIERLWSGQPYQAIWFVGRRHQSLQDHAAIMDRLRARDPQGAASAMLAHIGHGESATLAHLREIDAPQNESG